MYLKPIVSLLPIHVTYHHLRHFLCTHSNYMAGSLTLLPTKQFLNCNDSKKLKELFFNDLVSYLQLEVKPI